MAEEEEGLIIFKNLIDNKLVDPQSGNYIDNYDPSEGKVYSRIPNSGADDVNSAVEAAKAAFPAWSALSPAQRSSHLLKLADLIESNLSEFAKAESRDQGKPVWLATAVDIPRAVYNFRFFATSILHHTDSSSILHGPVKCVNYVVRKPVGVAGLISPWNLPLYLLTWKIAPAIAVWFYSVFLFCLSSISIN